jgi:capsular exopolysaccharide synthesis family protein
MREIGAGGERVMKRVSDALRRAAEEDVHSDTHSREGPQHGVLEIDDAKFYAATNGRSPTTMPTDDMKARPSYRKRIEELFFGWDLRNLKECPLVALETHSPAAEQYKILREQVRKICNERKANVILVTSAIKSDGKTKITANLAAALALDYNEQVLIIDADMRSPSLWSYFGVKSGPGLSAFLASNSETEPMRYVQETFVHGLSILTAGKPAINASELLTTEKMNKLIESLRRNFPSHRILIDSAPVLSTPDPLVLSRHVNGILMVVRAGHTPRAYVSKAIKLLDAKQLIGVILNGAELEIASKYYYAVRS